MSEIRLNKIYVNGKNIEYSYSYSEELSKYFSSKPFLVTYDVIIDKVPDSILVIPFLSNILPIMWLTNSTVYIDELDEGFFGCIQEVKKGYEKMFPNVPFLGELSVNHIVGNRNKNIEGKSAMFFSGGLDSYQTLISHIEENPLLISVWGADIKYDSVTGWENLEITLKNAGEKYNLQISEIKSSFREFDEEGELDKSFHSLLGDGWWHGVKHGIGLIGHVAPLAYLFNIERLYIASTNWPEQGIQKCASSPWTDNNVRFCDTIVIHDGYEYSRQDKVHNIVRFAQNNKDTIDLHVCWQTQTGKNCCHCEKCYRTMAGIFVEGADPIQFGFEYSKVDLIEMERIIKTFLVKETISTYWPNIRKVAIEKQKYLKNSKYYFWYKWILNTDFNHPEDLKLSLKYRSFRKFALLINRVFSIKK